MEYREKCLTCGKIFCYSSADVRRNYELQEQAAKEQITAGLDFLVGRGPLVANQERNRADRLKSQMVDYSRCPSCGSTNVVPYSKEDEEKDAKLKAGVSINASASNESLLKRVALFLEEEDWISAEAYCEHILDSDPEDARAYIYKLLAEKKVKSVEELSALERPFTDSLNYKRAMRYADEAQKNSLDSASKEIVDRERRKKEKQEQLAAAKEAAKKKKLDEENEWSYQKAISLSSSTKRKDLAEAIEIFSGLKGYKDSDSKKLEAEKRLTPLKKSARKRNGIIAAVCLVIVVVVALVSYIVIPPMNTYNKAEKSLNEGDYATALSSFKEISGYRDADSRADEVIEAAYESAKADIANGSYSSAKEKLTLVGDFKDAKSLSSKLINVPVRILRASSYTWTFKYDSTGKMSQINSNDATFDQDGRIVTYKQDTTYTYTYEGETVTKTSPSGKYTWTFSSPNLGKAAPIESSTKYTYNSDGSIAQVEETSSVTGSKVTSEVWNDCIYVENADSSIIYTNIHVIGLI